MLKRIFSPPASLYQAAPKSLPDPPFHATVSPRSGPANVQSPDDVCHLVEMARAFLDELETFVEVSRPFTR